MLVLAESAADQDHHDLVMLMNQGKSSWPHALYCLAAFSQQMLTDLIAIADLHLGQCKGLKICCLSVAPQPPIHM